MRAPLAAGAPFVVLDESVVRLPLTGSEIDLALNWRYGPATRDVGDESFVDLQHSFSGVGLRPLAPVHVRGKRAADDLFISWIRRTRVGGDSWTVSEVPLAETEERYEIDILDGATVVRTLTSTAPAVVYSSGDQVADFGSPQALVSVRVHQMSALAGRGTGRTASL